MITAADAIARANLTADECEALDCAVARADVVLTSDEEREVAKFEATIDGVLSTKFRGPMRVEFPQEVRSKIAVELRRRYEAGGWSVGIKLTPAAAAFSFTPRSFGNATTPQLAALPAIATVAAPVASAATGRRLLVRMPTRNRPTQALAVLEKYRSMAGCPVEIEVIIDVDDASMMAADVLQRLLALDCVVTPGRHRTKIEACNAGRVNDWDVLLLASDDMVPVVNGYAVRVLDAMHEHFPFLDGAIYFDDGYQGKKCCTLPIMGRRLYDQFGYVYAPAYQSLYSDAEYTELLTQMSRLTYVDERLIEHRHPATRLVQTDALYERNDAAWKHDKTMYEFRKKQRFNDWCQFGFNAPPMRLSVCIPTIPGRERMMRRLYEHIYAQAQYRPRAVEILVDDRATVPVNDKRQSLLERAHGHYVVFIDDDDYVAHDYVARILSKVQANADVMTFRGVMTTAGAAPESVEYSLKYNEWRSEGGIHYRTPCHLNPVKREIALKVGHAAKSVYAEDFEYAMRLRPELNTEAYLGDAPMYFYFFDPAKGYSRPSNQ